MTADERFIRVSKIIRDSLALRDEIALGDMLNEDLGADSLDRCEIAMGIEDEFLVDCVDDEQVLRGWVTVGDVVAWVEENAPTEAQVEKLTRRR